jgi:serine protease AprX
VSVDVPNATVNVIVQHRSKPENTQFSKVLRKNGVIRNHLDVVNGAALTVPVSELSDLDSDPDVAYVSPDRPVRGTATTALTLDYYYPTVNANYADQLGYDGTGIGVAVIDSGIVPVPDLNAPNPYYPNSQYGSNYRVVYSQSFVSGGSGVDLYGHGTHVSGIIGGNGSKSTGWNYAYTFTGLLPTST